jgi:hypothetical protein
VTAATWHGALVASQDEEILWLRQLSWRGQRVDVQIDLRPAPAALNRFFLLDLIQRGHEFGQAVRTGEWHQDVDPALHLASS